jgi:rare lipoprotein A
MTRRPLTLAAAVLLAAACSSVPPRSVTSQGATPQAAPPASGKYYLDDGPGANPPPDLDAIPDAMPRIETLHRAANRPYAVFGREYVPATMLKPYRERGIASWYGRRFHGQKTSIGESYDMYAMTAAHPTLPLPSYARVTNVATGKSVVVRVNDRGPFLHDRIIDLSYAAAHRIGIAQNGSGEVEVEAILPGTLAQTAQLAQPPLAVVADAPASTPPLASVVNGSVITMPLAPVATVVPTTSAASVEGAAASASTLAAAAPVQSSASDADVAPVAPMRGGYSVQLGAFASFANAQAFLGRAQNQLATARVEARIRQAGGFYRVYIGPYPSRSEAEQLSARITQAFGFPTTIAAH